MNKLPGFQGNVISNLAECDINVAAKDFVSTNIFKSDRVMVEVRLYQNLDGIVMKIFCGKYENAIVDVPSKKNTSEMMVKPWFEALYPDGFTEGNSDETKHWADLVTDGGTTDLAVTLADDTEDAKFKAEMNNEKDVKELDLAMSGGGVSVGAFEKPGNTGGGLNLDGECEVGQRDGIGCDVKVLEEHPTNSGFDGVNGDGRKETNQVVILKSEMNVRGSGREKGMQFRPELVGFVGGKMVWDCDVG